MIWISIWVHFMRHHMWDTIVVLEEDNHSLPHYPKCDMFFIWRELNKNHQATSMYAWGDYRRLERLCEKEARSRTVGTFEAYGRPLETVTAFKYLGIILTASDNGWP